MILAKISDGGILTLCDEDILGKHFEDEHHTLDITRRFYQGEILSKKELLKVLESATCLNLVGKSSVAFVLGEGFISQKDVLFIQGVAHVQIYAV